MLGLKLTQDSEQCYMVGRWVGVDGRINLFLESLVIPLPGPVVDIEEDKAETDNAEERGLEQHILLGFLRERQGVWCLLLPGLHHTLTLLVQYDTLCGG